MEGEVTAPEYGDAVPAVTDDPEANESDDDSIDKKTEENHEENGSKFKQKFLGDYDYGMLCRPRWNPWAKGATKELQWFGPDSNLAVLLATFLGFQHSLAVVGGTVLPGIILGQLDPSGQAAPFLVSYALITSGICTWIQIAHTPICKTKYFLGSGLLCVIATSFAFIPTAVTSINTQIEAGKSFDEAYGSLLGVFMVGAVFQSGFSFIPGPILRKIFPPWLAGLGVFLIGVSLVGVGVEQWGGGCSPNTVCNVGQSNLLYGSSEYLGLGFLVMCTIVFLELFGSPFLRSCSIAFALLFGYLISALTSDRNGESYTDNTTIKEAPVILFLWVKTFPIGFYSPALIPTLIAYVVSTIETYGDTTATAEASGFIPNDEASGKKFDEAIQGGLLGDSVNSLISALSMVLPSTTLSQNIGIISLTRVAARGAGYACGIWMLIYGVFGKVGAFFTSIPPPVLGGMSTFLFANIATSGIKVMTSEGVNRRARFILAVSGAFGLGTIIVPEWFTSAGFLDCPAIESPGLRGLCDAAVTTLSTGYAVGCLVALILNGILPNDPEGDGADEEGTPLTKDSTLELSCNALVDESDEIVPDSKADEENAISSTT